MALRNIELATGTAHLRILLIESHRLSRLPCGKLQAISHTVLSSTSTVTSTVSIAQHFNALGEPSGDKVRRHTSGSVCVPGLVSSI
jgi:hypothetical protein